MFYINFKNRMSMGFAANSSESPINRHFFAANTWKSTQNIIFRPSMSKRTSLQDLGNFQNRSPNPIRRHWKPCSTFLTGTTFPHMTIWEPGTMVRRNGSTLAIVKNIEKNGINPTKAMMQLLFEQAPPKDEEPDLIEIGPQETLLEKQFQDGMEAIELRKERTILKNELEETRKRFGALLFERIKETRTGFGKSRLYLDMTLEEFKELKSKYKNQ